MIFDNKKIFFSVGLSLISLSLLAQQKVPEPTPSAADSAVIEKFGSPKSTPQVPQKEITPPSNSTEVVVNEGITSNQVTGGGSAPSTGSTPMGSETETVTGDSTVPPTNEAGEELVYLNATDVNIKDLIKQISKSTGTNFLIDEKVRGKVTIISEKPMTKEMAYQAFLSSLEVMGFTTVKTPGGLLKIVPTKEAINEPLEIYKDSTPNTDGYITRIVQVKNISANELSTVVKTLVSKEGNLFAYPATNSLIITDSGSNIDRILKIVRELDQEGPQEVIEIVPIRNANANDITTKVLSLFEDETNKPATGGTARVRRGARGAVEELADAPSISKVIADERTNSVIILGSKRSILKIRALIARLDADIAGIEGSIHVYYLKHASAKEMSETISSLVSGASKTAAKEGADKGAASKTAGTLQLEADVKITADEATNSLVITASPKDYETLLEKVVQKLDIPRRQVYLEAVVMELSVGKTRQFGVAGNLGGLLNLAGNSVTAFGAIPPLAPQALQGIAAASGGLGAGLISQSNIEFSTTGADGSSTTIQVPAVSAILQALQSDSDVNILSTPSVLTLDNQEAHLLVGGEVPIRNGTSIAAGGVQNFNVTRQDFGIDLTVKPQISESDTVQLDVAQKITDIVPNSGTEDGPIFSKREVKTVVVAQDKQTVVIGGLINDKNTTSQDRIPFLGDIPVVGNLFKNKTVAKEKTNIIVFITPYVIRDKSDYLSILQKKIEERNLFIDLNYGLGQRKQIRESIRLHAKELLEFKPHMGRMDPSLYAENHEDMKKKRPSSSETGKTAEKTVVLSKNKTANTKNKHRQ